MSKLYDAVRNQKRTHDIVKIETKVADYLTKQIEAGEFNHDNELLQHSTFMLEEMHHMINVNEEQSNHVQAELDDVSESIHKLLKKKDYLGVIKTTKNMVCDAVSAWIQ